MLSGSAALDLLPPPDPTARDLKRSTRRSNPRARQFDWLSRDRREVDKYIADPLCGFSANTPSMMSIFAAAAPLFEPGALRRIRRELPIYLFAGDKDPLNGGLAFLTPLVERYRAAGIKDVTHDFYAGGRHEMLNETNRAEVVENLGLWIDRAITAKRET